MTQIPVMVKAVTPINELVKRFDFVRRDGLRLPNFSAGAHTVVQMEDAGTLRRNAYSLMSSPEDTSYYSISVRREDNGRGGSLYMHQYVKEGMEMEISVPMNLFPLNLRGRKHILIAGGIGITPFMAQMAQLTALGSEFELHYGVRNKALASYAEELTTQYGSRVHIYYSDNGEKIDLAELLKPQKTGTEVYVCGPKPMIEWVLDTAQRVGWPPHALHYEEFKAPSPGKVFEVDLSLTGKTVQVGSNQSMLEALEAAHVDAPYLCRGGACGQCEIAVNECDGEIDHQDHWLTEEQRKENKLIMPCVSRFEGKKLVVEL